MTPRMFVERMRFHRERKSAERKLLAYELAGMFAPSGGHGGNSEKDNRLAAIFC